MQGREEGRDPAALARATAQPAAVAASEPDQKTTFACADAHQDVETVKNLYQALVEAKKQCGEATDDLSFPRFHHLIAKKTDNLKEHLGCERVLFSVHVQDGQVSFKAKADKDK